MFKSARDIFAFLFGFSSGEAGAFTILMPLLGLIIYSEPLYDHFFPATSGAIEVRILDSLLEVREPVHMFYFDPNRVSVAAMDSLGMDDQLAGRMVRYRSAGGVFRKPKDLLRLYGMDTAEYRRLEPWIRISGGNSEQPKITSPPDGKRKSGSPRTFDLNAADTSDFEAWPGIGHKTAVRIMRYRDALGGFLRREQLYEVWAIDSLAVFSMEKFFVEPGFQPRRINLNSATEELLERHPYLTRYQARAILFYRYQHGPFRTLDDLRKVRMLDDATLVRILPYLGTE